MSPHPFQLLRRSLSSRCRKSPPSVKDSLCETRSLRACTSSSYLLLFLFLFLFVSSVCCQHSHHRGGNPRTERDVTKKLRTKTKMSNVKERIRMYENRGSPGQAAVGGRRLFSLQRSKRWREKRRWTVAMHLSAERRTTTGFPNSCRNLHCGWRSVIERKMDTSMKRMASKMLLQLK